jgi:hypothetical protein
MGGTKEEEEEEEEDCCAGQTGIAQSTQRTKRLGDVEIF